MGLMTVLCTAAYSHVLPCIRMGLMTVLRTAAYSHVLPCIRMGLMPVLRTTAYSHVLRRNNLFSATLLHSASRPSYPYQFPHLRSTISFLSLFLPLTILVIVLLLLHCIFSFG